MRILIVEPFFTGSHAAWAEEYARNSRHRVDILHLGGHYWKWRMHGGAVTLARRFLQTDEMPDLILATDMLDLTTFLALTRRRTAAVPAAVYFHENQMGYPWSPRDPDVAHGRDQHYGFINYSAALAADRIFFNSGYHRRSFLEHLPRFLNQFPDHQGLENVATVRAKSAVLPLGVDLRRFDRKDDRYQGKASFEGAPVIVWNHRWSHDKNPEEFFRALFVMNDRGLDFRVAVLGQGSQESAIFEAARRKLQDKVVQYGYVEAFSQYARWLWRADIAPVTSRQDFFGVSLVQALYCGCYPLLPRRLTYPELVPCGSYPEVFYDSFEELVEKLAQAMEGIDEVRRQSFRRCIAAYDWQRLGPVYDATFEAMLHCP